MTIIASISSDSVIGTKGKEDSTIKKQTNSIVGISDGKAHEYKIGNVTFTVFSEFEPMKSENTIKSRFEKSITSDFTDLTGEIFEDTMAEEYVCSAAGKED